MQSHPMWVRGLKLNAKDYGVPQNRSHPMWVRGLKLNNYVVSDGVLWCRTPCGCVD